MSKLQPAAAVTVSVKMPEPNDDSIPIHQASRPALFLSRRGWVLESSSLGASHAHGLRAAGLKFDYPSILSAAAERWLMKRRHAWHLRTPRRRACYRDLRFFW